jgi:hypothetical protein
VEGLDEGRVGVAASVVAEATLKAMSAQNRASRSLFFAGDAVFGPRAFRQLQCWGREGIERRAAGEHLCRADTPRL